MATIPSFFHGVGEKRAEKLAGWTKRQPSSRAKPAIYRILQRGDWQNSLAVLLWLSSFK